MIVPPPSRPCGAGDGGVDSGQAALRHPERPLRGCFLPDLTRFVVLRRAGPDRQRPVSTIDRRHVDPRAGELSPAWRGFRVQGTPSAPPITIDIKGRRAPIITNIAPSGRRAL